MKEITVEIDVNGNTKVTTRGFSGADCLKETAALEAALGVKKSSTPTPEMNRTTAHKLNTGGSR